MEGSRSDLTTRRQIQGPSEREEQLSKEVEGYRRLAEAAAEGQRKAEEEVARLQREIEDSSSRARAAAQAAEGRCALAGERIAQLEEEKKSTGEIHAREVAGFQDSLTKATGALEQARRDWTVLASEANLVREQRDALGREASDLRLAVIQRDGALGEASRTIRALRSEEARLISQQQELVSRVTGLSDAKTELQNRNEGELFL